MRNSTTLPRIVVLVFVLMLIGIVGSRSVSAGIFDGGSSGGGGIFGGMGDSLGGIFDSIGDAIFPGGAVIPGLTPVPTLAPGQPTPTPRNTLPASPGDVKELKLTLEWDSLSLGGEAVYPQVDDPLVCIHLGEELGPPECAGSGYPGLVECGNCGTAYSDTYALDDQGRIVPTSVLGVQVQAAEPPGPSTPDSGGPGPVDQLLWSICAPSDICKEDNVTHAIVGWCGQDPVVQDTAGWDTTIPVNSSGPNSYSLPNAVSNKYIRRDGYAFQCVVSNCQGGTCAEDNYMEFQTMIYPSNAISLTLNVENVSDQKIDNVLIKSNTLTYSSTGETPLPHNLDYMNEGGLGYFDNPSYNGFGVSDVSDVSGGWGYTHGHLITDIDVAGVKFGIGTDPSDHNVTQFQYGPFSIGPGETIELPYQPSSAEFTEIPGTTFSIPKGDIEPVEIAKPCECQSVKIHDSLGIPANGCNQAVRNPTVDQCRLYYGIGVVHDGTNYADHSGGYVCDLQAIPVEGCPPPWCFDGAVSEVGPLEQCQEYIDNGAPDLDNNGKIDNPQDSGNEWWYLTPPVTRETHESDIGLKSVAQKVLPEFVLGLFSGDSTPDPKEIFSEDVSAFGCPQPCQNQPPPGIQGKGGIIPRDYNFICDPKDTYDDGEMVEKERCDGTDFATSRFSTIIPPSEKELFRTYRDVTGIGGCGYNASSNNSVIGPIQIVAEHGGTGDARTSRSVLLASIPIGGRLVDDQARPYGYPVTGEIEQDWGYTGYAANQGPYRSSPWQNYGEYRYCSASDLRTPPPASLDKPGCDTSATISDPTLNNVKPLDKLLDTIVGSKVRNWVAETTALDDYGLQETLENVALCYNDVIQTAIETDNDPAFAMAIWLEESGASNYYRFPDVADFGCVHDVDHNDFAKQLACFVGLKDDYLDPLAYKDCHNKRTPIGLTVEKFLQIYQGGHVSCEKNNWNNNPNFLSRIQSAYMVAREDGAELNLDCPLTQNINRWDDTCSSVP